ncbi:hypothetical protein AB4212_03115, partial [Streptomyces sp. 2MCAF27]
MRIGNVSSFVLGGVASLLGARTRWQHRVSLFRAANPWSGEYRWEGTPTGAGLVDVGMTRFGQTGSKTASRRPAPGRGRRPSCCPWRGWGARPACSPGRSTTTAPG